jgi:hypothetical protein
MFSVISAKRLQKVVLHPDAFNVSVQDSANPPILSALIAWNSG